MSDEKKPTTEERDDSIMSEEELETVAGGCQWGNETTGPKFPDTLQEPPTFPITINPYLA